METMKNREYDEYRKKEERKLQKFRNVRDDISADMVQYGLSHVLAKIVMGNYLEE